MTNKPRATPAPCDITCPVRRTARILDGKWTTLIVRDLLGGKKRYSELLRSLDGISPKVLAARLKFLEGEGIVDRQVFPVVPPHTEYRLTVLGKSLARVIYAMRDMGRKLQRAEARGQATK
jgi:DNA-binding HxlR family transcriptional regulator